MEAIEAFSKSMPDLKNFSFPKIDNSHFDQLQKHALTIFPVIQQRFDVHAPQLAELQRTMQRIALPTLEAQQQLSEAVKGLRASFECIQWPTAEYLKLVQQIAQSERRKQALDRIGLLPHSSTPWDMLDSEPDDDQLKGNVENYYRKNWDEVSAAIVRRAAYFAIDDEAKAALAEGLQAHQHGYYRSVCRLLLPEIERVARVELEGDRVGALHVDKVIGEPAGGLGLSQISPQGYFTVGLYRRLTAHLYEHVNASNRAAFQDDPVPNRHAAIHGLIVYNSFCHSLNVIFLTDYAFQVVTAVVKQRSDPT